MQDQLFSSLDARLRSPDRSAVLDPAARDEASQLWEVATVSAKDALYVDVDVLTLLAYLHWTRFQYLPDGQDHDDLRDALMFFGMLRDGAPERVPDQVAQILASEPPPQPDGSEGLNAAGIEALNSYKTTGNTDMLEAALSAFRRAVDSAPAEDPDRSLYLANLGTSLRRRFERIGDAADLDEAVQALRQAVDAAPLDEPNRAGLVSMLGNVLATRFERTGNEADLDAAVQAGRQAVDAASPDDPNCAMYLCNLGIALRLRFERTGDGVDLDAAVQAGQQGVDTTAPNHPERAGRLTNLGLSLRLRFERTGQAEDLDAAVQAGQQAVDTTASNDPGRAIYLSGLGSCLLRRFERTGSATDLDSAIRAGLGAVDATPPDHPDRAGDLSNLGGMLWTRFNRIGDAADLDAAIWAHRQAVDATPRDDPGYPMALSNLGVTLRTRFEHTGDEADLTEAVQVGRQAVDATAPDLPDLAMCLSNLGIALRTRFDHLGKGADLDDAIESWRKASEVLTGTPSNRMDAARRWGAVAADNARTSQAVQGYKVAVGLLPAVAWQGLDRATQQEQLVQSGGLASDAAASAILGGHPALAIELLEQGRSVMWSQALNLRTDLTALTQTAPHLAERLDSIRAILHTPLPNTSRAPAELLGDTASRGGVPRREALDRRRRLAREWDQTLTEVRALKGFAHFLAPTPYTELAAAVVDGPVVLVNASIHGCHALIVHPGRQQPQVVSLPNLTRDTAIDRANQMLDALEGPRRTLPEREKALLAVLDVLDWLWDVIADPILTALGHSTAPSAGDAWPRVCWSPTGPLSVLPIHAAGHHPRHRTTAGVATDGGRLSVLDLVVSSYTPTLTALARAREPGSVGPVRQLTVGMPTTPGLSPLGAVSDELAVLARYFPSGEMNAQLVGSEATRQAVLDAITTHPWVHLACHAGQEQADPTSSSFALWDGPLTIGDLIAAPTQHRDLAFLSACQTATGAVRQLDEAIHLAAAMQFLGYRHVIATMWTIADSPAPQVADAVYSALINSGERQVGQTARALHEAIGVLRARTRPTPSSGPPTPTSVPNLTSRS